MNVFKNILTGEYHVADNKTRAWLYFFYKAERKGEDKPTMNDVIIIEIERKINLNNTKDEKDKNW
jgi:hypothetical protein